jgi:hypothetical protein
LYGTRFGEALDYRDGLFKLCMNKFIRIHEERIQGKRYKKMAGNVTANKPKTSLH